MGLADKSVGDKSSTLAISTEIIGLLKSITGRGPTKSRTHVLPDCVVVLMREGHTVAEGSMAGAGQARAVAQGRVDLSEDQRGRFIEVVEKHTGRRVISFLTSSHQEPSVLSLVFVLDTAVALLEDEPLTE